MHLCSSPAPCRWLPQARKAPGPMDLVVCRWILPGETIKQIDVSNLAPSFSKKLEGSAFHLDRGLALSSRLAFTETESTYVCQLGRLRFFLMATSTQQLPSFVLLDSRVLAQVPNKYLARTSILYQRSTGMSRVLAAHVFNNNDS